MMRVLGLVVLMGILVGCAAGDATTVAPTLPQAASAQPSVEMTEAEATETTTATEVPPTEVATIEMPTEVMPTEQIGPITFVLTDETEARFNVDEVLFGSPKTVVGATNDVEGSLVPDFETPANTTVGTIRIDLSTLEIDDRNRTGQLHQNILQTGNEAYRYAEFVPTSLSGMPESITIGQAFSFQITGNLTIHGTTLEKTFDVMVTPVSETRLEGLATLHILYSEFGVQILRLPRQVASVEDNVILELDFVAEPG